MQYFCVNEICYILNAANLQTVAQPVNILFHGFKMVLELMTTHFTSNLKFQDANIQKLTEANSNLTFEQFVMKRREENKIKEIPKKNLKENLDYFDINVTEDDEE